MNTYPEIIKTEIEKIYTNVLFYKKESKLKPQWEQFNKTQHNITVLNTIGTEMWRHVLILSYDGSTIDVHPSIYGPRIELPLSLDLNDPESIEKLCQMIDECGGKRRII